MDHFLQSLALLALYSSRNCFCLADLAQITCMTVFVASSNSASIALKIAGCRGICRASEDFYECSTHLVDVTIAYYSVSIGSAPLHR